MTRRMPRRDFLKGSAASIAAFTLLGDRALEAEVKSNPPNFILINCDDLGYGDLGCYGNQTIATPKIDQLAKSGVRFKDFYSGAAVCTPSRACLMTGRYIARTGLTRVLFPDDIVGITDKELTIAQLLKKRGYATACIGKWHLGHLPQFLPTRHGFDSYYGIPYSNDMDNKEQNRPPTPLMRNEEIVEQPAAQETLTERYTEEAVKFIKGHKGEPFFLYLAHTMPHIPLHVSEKFKGRSKGGLYGDVVETIDWGVGEIVKTLREMKIERNTLVIFTSDNGPWLEMKENGGSAGPFRAGKGTQFEGGMRVPFVASRPGRIPAGSICVDPASNLDILPTLVSMAGGTLPTDRTIDGRDITDLILCRETMPEYPFFYIQQNSKVAAVRYGNWKLHVGRKGETLPEPELYDLDNDIGEKTNLAAKYPKTVEKLKQMIEEFVKTLPVKPAE